MLMRTTSNCLSLGNDPTVNVKWRNPQTNYICIVLIPKLLKRVITALP